MFTGLITDVGEMVFWEKKSDIFILHIKTSYDCASIQKGASISCDGCCLTVVEKQSEILIFEVSSETYDRTTMALWKKGQRINLERSLKVGDELSGHFVSGHVDGRAKIISIEKPNVSQCMGFELPVEFSSYIVPKGSITLNGISLTMNAVKKNFFYVMIIPYTLDHTNLSCVKEGQYVNFELDIFVRYLRRFNQIQEEGG